MGIKEPRKAPPSDHEGSKEKTGPRDSLHAVLPIMPDPFTAVGFSAAIVGLANFFTGLISNLKSIYERYKTFGTKLLRIVEHLGTRRATLLALEKTFETSIVPRGQRHIQDFIRDVRPAIHSCKAIIKELDDQVQRLDYGGRTAKARFAADPSRINGQLSDLDRHFAGLSGMLQVRMHHS